MKEIVLNAVKRAKNENSDSKDEESYKFKSKRPMNVQDEELAKILETSQARIRVVGCGCGGCCGIAGWRCLGARWC